MRPGSIVRPNSSGCDVYRYVTHSDQKQPHNSGEIIKPNPYLEVYKGEMRFISLPFATKKSPTNIL